MAGSSSGPVRFITAVTGTTAALPDVPVPSTGASEVRWV